MARRTLTYFIAVSIDGFIADPQGGFGDFLMEGDHIEALFAEVPETLPAPALRAAGISPACERFDTVIMGWDTYDVGRGQGLDDPYPHLRQYVCTRRHLDVPVGEGIELRTDPAALVRELEAEDSPAGIWLCGGGQLAAALADHIDELVLKVNPIILGSGRPLFAGTSLPRMELVESRTFTSGVVFNSYRRPA